MKLLLFALMLVAAPALAHDHWINKPKYRSPSGVHCCSADQDCKVWPADKVKVTPAGFVLSLTDFMGNSFQETIPFEQAIVSEDGNYWRCGAPYRTTRCFFYVPPGY